MSEKKALLENVAIEAVQKSGLNNLSFRTLADEIGIKSSSVHYYFPEKGHLAAALIDKYRRNLAEKIAEIDQQHSRLKDKLHAFVQIFVEVVENGKFCLCGMLAAEVATLSDDNKQRLQGYFDTAEHWLSNTLNSHKDQYQSPMGVDELAKMIISGLEGAILLDRVEGGTARIRAQSQWIEHLCK